MLRVVAALLLAAAALAAVDLRGLVDVVYNTTSPLERLTPTYVLEIDGCRALVQVVDSPPNIFRMYNEVYYPRNKTLRPLTSAEVESLLNALFQALGPSTRAWVEVLTKHAYGEGYDILRSEVLHIEAKDAAQLAEEVRRAVGVDFYLSLADARKALDSGAREAAYLYKVEWLREDLAVIFNQLSTSLVLETANFSAAVEALEKAREAAGELWNSVEVVLWHGSYLVPDDTIKAVVEAVIRLEKELGDVWKYRDEWGLVRRFRGIIEFSEYGVGPLYLSIPYPNGTVLDRATAERLVRRFVELSGFCKSPLVVEFWPKTVFVSSPPLWPFVATGAVVAVAVGLVLARRRR